MHTANIQCFRMSRNFLQVGESPFHALKCRTPKNIWCPIAVFFTVVECFKKFDSSQNTIRWKPSYLLCHKSGLAIGDNLIGFSCSCVSHDFWLEHFTQMLYVLERWRLRNILHSHKSTSWNVENSETSGVRCVRPLSNLVVLHTISSMFSEFFGPCSEVR